MPEKFPTKVAVLGDPASVEWVRFVARLWSDDHKIWHYPHQPTAWTFDNALMAGMLEEFYALNVTDIAKSLWGSANLSSLDKIVILDDDFITRTSPSIALNLRHRRKNWLFPTRVHFIPAFLQLVPVTFVALTTNSNPEYHAKLRKGGIDLVFNPLTEPAGMLRERLKARRDAIEFETEFSATRNLRNFVWTIAVGVVLAPLLLEFAKWACSELGTKYGTDVLTLCALALIALHLLVTIPLMISWIMALILNRREQFRDQTSQSATLFPV